VVSPALALPTRLRGDLDDQDIAGRLSQVRPICCPVDPMRRYWEGKEPFAAPTAGLAARLAQLAHLLEWSYGYRTPRHRGQRLSRRAPSAGALYPSETFLVVDTGSGWKALYYDFLHQGFYAAKADAAALAGALALPPGGAAFLLVSVLWRTVQRYGVRGYRYCLLDAGHVASNLMSVARHCGLAAVAEAGLTADMERRLGLEEGEALVLSVSVGGSLLESPVPRPPRPPSPTHILAPAIEHAPLLSPVLRRVHAFHARTLAHDRVPLSVPELSRGAVVPDLETWADERYSAKDFRPAGVPSSHLERMAEVAWRSATPGGACAVHVISLRVDGAPVAAGSVTADGSLRWSAGPRWAPEAMARRLSAACQGQSLVLGCSFAVVLSADSQQVLDGGYAGYRPFVLQCGFVGAELYREAVRLGLGTTTIGGFSDGEVASLLGDPDLHPVVVQVFGRPEAEAIKVDAARWVAVPPLSRQDSTGGTL